MSPQIHEDTLPQNLHLYLEIKGESYNLNEVLTESWDISTAVNKEEGSVLLRAIKSSVGHRLEMCIWFHFLWG